MTGNQRTKVLFICLGNSCRSPMAEAIAARMAPDVVEASSAGLVPLGIVQPSTVATLTRNGYPASNLRSKPLRFPDLQDADVVINMSGQRAAWTLRDTSKVEDWAVEDPYGEDAATYQRVFENLEKRVAELVGRVRKMGTGRRLVGNLSKETAGQ